MKKILSSLTFLLIPFYFICAQYPINETTGKVCYSEVIETDFTKEELYVNAQNWIINTFGEYKNTIQLDDKENGIIILKGRTNINNYLPLKSHCSGGFNYTHTYDYFIKIECKNKKFRYTLSDISTHSDRYKSEEHSFEEELERRKLRLQTLNDLLNMDISKLKKNEKKERERDICVSNVFVEADKDLLTKDSEEFESLCNSLKSAMIINRDF